MKLDGISCTKVSTTNKVAGTYTCKSADETCSSGYTVIPSKGGTLYCGKIETKSAIKVEE